MPETNLISDAMYIDPSGVDSQVSYKINLNTYEEKDGTTSRSLSASVMLSDCSRRIDWYFKGDEDSLEKIDKAIGMLTAFRRNLKAQIHQLKKIGGK